MKNGNGYPDWFLWLWERGLLAVVLGVTFLLVVAAVGVIYLENRLVELEQHLVDAPPRDYQPPDLAAKAVTTLPAGLSAARTIYVPVYSHVYYQGGRPFSLETTLSVRNTDPRRAIYVTSVDYFDTAGQLATSYLSHTVRLAPLETIEFLVPQQDSRGGSGANFLVRWQAEPEADLPLVEAVMVGNVGAQSVAFARPGVVLRGDRSGEASP